MGELNEGLDCCLARESGHREREGVEFSHPLPETPQVWSPRECVCVFIQEKLSSA